MGPERHRRLAVVALLSLFLLLSSWMEDDHQENNSGPTSTIRVVAGRLRGYLTSGRRATSSSSSTAGRRGDVDRRDRRGDTAGRQLGGDSMSENSGSSKSKGKLFIRSPAHNVDLYSCLPRFICEINARAGGAELSEMERDILAIFRNYVVLEGPGSPVYPYQLAAHMGQLLTGLDPSPCQNLYPSCPLSRVQIVEVLRGVKTSKKFLS